MPRHRLRKVAMLPRRSTRTRHVVRDAESEGDRSTMKSTVLLKMNNVVVGRGEKSVSVIEMATIAGRQGLKAVMSDAGRAEGIQSSWTPHQEAAGGRNLLATKLRRI